MIDIVYDGNSLFARSWFAAQRISPDPREALRLAVNTVVLLLNPDTNKIGCPIDRSLFAWDSHQNKEKDRDQKPPEYHDTKEILQSVLTFMFGTVHAENKEVEADDIVATVVAKANPSDTVFVVSGDKDLIQLQGGNCRYYSLHDKAILTSSFITHKFQSIKNPAQLALLLAIVGDPVDNIGGIFGFGPVRCKKLFEQVTPEMNFEQAANAITAQLTEEQTEQFYTALNRTLLKTNIPGIPDPAPLRLQHPEEVENLGIPQIGLYYRQLYAAYVRDSE